VQQSPPEKTIQIQPDDQIANCFALSVTDANEAADLYEPAIIHSPEKVVVESSPEELLLQTQQQQQI
jgi:hypothetical protein